MQEKAIAPLSGGLLLDGGYDPAPKAQAGFQHDQRTVESADIIARTGTREPKQGPGNTKRLGRVKDPSH